MGDNMSTDTGLARIAPRSFSLLPTTLGEAREMAEMIARSDFAPKDYKDKPANVIIAVQMGADLGLKPMQALQNIAVINGRPSIWGDAALALAMPVLEYVNESFEGTGDDLTAVCAVKRKGWPSETKRTFSVKDAKAASLWTKAGPWQNYPKRMLQMRARSFALRDVAADLMMGLVLAEEAQDYPNDDPNTINAEVVRVEDVPDPMLQIPEAMRESVGKGFEALNMGAGPRLAKINEFMQAEKGTPDEKAQTLLDWLKDEYSRRKTGQPRKSSNNAKTASGSAPAPEAPAASKGTAQNPAGATGENRPATPAATEMPQAPVAGEIFKGGAVERPQVDAVEF